MGDYSRAAAMKNTKKRFILIFLFIFSSVAFAAAVSDFAIAAGAIAGVTALAAVVGVAVGAPLVVPAALVVGLALELANYAFFAKNNQAYSNVLPEIKKALLPMTADQQAKYDNQRAAEDGGGISPSNAPITYTAWCNLGGGYISGGQCLFPGSVNTPIGGVDSLVCVSGTLNTATNSCSNSSCPVGTSVDVNGFCQITPDPSAPRYVRTSAGNLMPNPANPPDYGSGYIDISGSPDVIDMMAPDGSSVRVAPATAGSTWGDSFPPLEITVTGGGGAGTTEPTLVEHCFSDGSCTESTVIPAFEIVDPQGNPSVIPVVATQPIDKSGSPVGPPIVQAAGPPLVEGTGVPVGPETTCPPNTTLDYGYCIPNAGNPYSDPGTGTTPGTGTGTGTGSCTSGDCSTESTQLANNGLLSSIKGLLQSIKDFFTGTSTAPGDPDAKTTADIKGAGLSGSGTFAGLSGWTLPGHASQCPTSSFVWNDRTFTIEAHCQLISDNFGVFRAIMTAVFSLSALFVVLKA